MILEVSFTDVEIINSHHKSKSRQVQTLQNSPFVVFVDKNLRSYFFISSVIHPDGAENAISNPRGIFLSPLRLHHHSLQSLLTAAIASYGDG